MDRLIMLYNTGRTSGSRLGLNVGKRHDVLRMALIPYALRLGAALPPGEEAYYRGWIAGWWETFA